VIGSADADTHTIPPYVYVAYSYHYVGWEDQAGQRYPLDVDNPPNSRDVFGLIVQVVNAEDPEDQDHIFVPIYGRMRRWDDFAPEVEIAITDHGADSLKKLTQPAGDWEFV